LETDISINPSILFETTISTSQLSLFGIRLGDPIEKVEYSNIISTGGETFPANVTEKSWRGDKTFYTLDGVEVEFELKERIVSVFENGGCIVMNTGARYRVKDKVVVDFIILDNILAMYKKVPKYEIEKKIGKADKINKHWENYDGTLFWTEYIYFDRQLYIMFHDWDKEIFVINIGKSGD
jgi:hypothetical protein